MGELTRLRPEFDQGMTGVYWRSAFYCSDGHRLTFLNCESIGSRTFLLASRQT